MKILNRIRALGWRAIARGLMGASLGLLGANTAHAQVSVGSLSLPSNVGHRQDVNVDIAWTRTTAAAATISTPLPAQVQVSPPVLPVGCVLNAGSVDCTVPAGGTGTTGTITFQVRGAVLGGFNLTATGTGGSNASNSSNVTSAGDLTVTKSKTSPAGNPITGQSTVFTLTPNLAVADDVPVSATIIVTDQLPGTSTDFNLTAIGSSGLVPSCNTAVAANSSRTVTCSYTGPFTVAAFNASTITLTGTPGNTGSFTNVGSIASGNVNYYDSNSGNNISNLGYTVGSGSDVQALGSFPGSGVQLNSAQTLTLTYRNNGPLNVPAGGTIATVIPAGFTVGVLPGACNRSGSGPWTITCTAGAVSNGNTQAFAIPLTMPGVAGSGNFPVTVTSPAGFGDAVPANNSVNVPYNVVPPFADLKASKTKTPGGPQPAGTVMTTTLTITNDGASTGAASYDAAHPLRIVDYLKPEEVSGNIVSTVTANWSCAVTTVVPPGFIDVARTTRVACESTDAGTLAIGAARAVSFSSTLTLGGQTVPIALPNTACTGSQALTALGLPDTAGPQPADGGRTSNDCVNDTANLVVTPVEAANAQASVQKLSSVDNTTFFDPAGSAPTLAADASTLYWRMVITTPTTVVNAGQTTIPTLHLADSVPGRQNISSGGAPAPGYLTPAITITTTPATWGSCPNLAAGSNGSLACDFVNVPPGSTITIDMAVQRPMASGTLTNTAVLTSPDAVLSASSGGQLSDSAAVIVTPRLDIALTTKTVTPATPRIGELVQFTITAQNLGPDSVTAAGQFTITDTLNITPDATNVGYEVLSATGTNMNCAASNLASGVISCTNTNTITRYAVRTITISARIKKPGSAMPPAGNVYTNQTNTATVALTGGSCEYKTETTTNALLSAACNDANATSNNSKTATFNVQVPAIDMKQRKERILPVGQTSFGLGDKLRYRFRVQANGPSRAEGIVMTDRLVIPPGSYAVEMDGAGGFPRTIMAMAINASAAESGYTLDATKAGTVQCTQTAANADVICNLSTVAANNIMDAGKEVNFELLFNMTPTTATAPVTFGNRAFICADETAAYESSGACSDVAGTAGNNLASVNDTVFPKNDLEVISKTTITPSPADINQPIQFNIVMRNNGGSTAVKMRLRDTLPTGLEWVNMGGHLPVVSIDAGSAATLSGPLTVSGSVPANGTDNVCFISNSITSLSSLVQQQEITCDISGNFPAGAGNTMTLALYARAKDGLYDGSAGAPYLANRTNSATIFPGLDATGADIAIDIVPGNNSKTSTVQIRNAQIAGRTFLDLNNNGDQNGSIMGSDQGLANVTITLTGTDLYGYPLSRSVTTDNSALGGASTRGDYLFTNLAPSDATGYTITQTQPMGYGNGTPVPNAARAIRNSVSTAISGPFTVSNTTTPDTSVIAGVRLAGGGNGVQFDFPEVQKPSLSGFVYLDADNNGLKTGADTGINGVTMNLIGCRAGANGVIDSGAISAGPAVCAGDDVAVNLTTVTATDPGLGAGYYLFPLDEPGRYSVIQQTPQPQLSGTTTLRGKTTAGSVDLVTSASGTNDGGTRGTINTTASNTGGTAGILQELANTVPASQIRDVVISNSAALSVNNNFGETLPASVGGVVYTEKGVLNSNYSAGSDWPFPNMPLVLTGTDDLGQAVNVPGSTNASGAYLFSNLRPGIYQVVKTNPGSITNEVGGAFPGKDAGNATRGTRVDDNSINTITLVSGAVVINTNFAVTNGPAPVNPTTSISGLVYIDRERNHALDPTDSDRIPGVTIRLVQGTSCEAGMVVQTTITDTAGQYYFANLTIGGNYLVCETQPAAYGNGNAKGTPGSNVITVSNLPAAGSNSNDFGEWVAHIDGYVWLDTNDNGVRDASEPSIPGVKVTLSGNDNNGGVVKRTATTDANGYYRFDNLLASDGGGYTVTEQLAQPVAPGTTKTTRNGQTVTGTINGTQIGQATPVTSVPSAVSRIVLPAGAASVNNNFGEVLTVMPDLVVTKSAGKVIFTEGNTATYTLRVKNIGLSPTLGSYTVTDTLPATGIPAKWTLERASGNGWNCTITADKLSVNCSHSAILQPGEEHASSISLTVNVGAGAAAFSPLLNLVAISGGGEPEAKKPQPDEWSTPKVCGATPEFNVCQQETPVQRPAGLNGHVWIDGGLKKVLDGSDKTLPQWIVEIYDINDPAVAGKTFTEMVRSGAGHRTTTTNSQGYYEVCDLEPGAVYRVLFRDPANRIAFPGVVTNELGTVTGADYWSQVKDREGFQVLEVKVPGSSSGPGCGGVGIAAPEQSLPLDPNGVVYDAKTRLPVTGAKVTLIPEGSCPGYDPKLHIINYETYSKDTQGNPVMTTGDDGFYKFLLSGDPTAPQSCQFRLAVESPTGYKIPPSGLIAPNPLLQTPGTPGIYEVQTQKLAPTGNQSTTYHFLLMAGLAHREIFNNHIPLDPLVPGKLLLTKQGDKRLAEVGDTVLYTITVRLLEGDPVTQATVRDRLPAGFTLVRGTVRLNNLSVPDPLGGLGPVLGFNLGALQPNIEARLTYRVRVGVGSMQGDGINRAQAHACQTVSGCLNPASLLPVTGSVASNEAQHKVDVTGGVFTDDACVLGKVFVDCNNNHIQDREELGIPGVRLYFEDGRFMVSDSEGKYSRCGLTPRSHVLTPDPGTLPRGSVLTTTSNRNLGDANSLFVDLKNGELHRADFAEGSCSNPVLEQVKARRSQGEVRSVETEKSSGDTQAPALRFQSKSRNYPQQGTDSANQPLVQPRQGASDVR